MRPFSSAQKAGPRTTSRNSERRDWSGSPGGSSPSACRQGRQGLLHDGQRAVHRGAVPGGDVRRVHGRPAQRPRRQQPATWPTPSPTATPSTCTVSDAYHSVMGTRSRREVGREIVEIRANVDRVRAGRKQNRPGGRCRKCVQTTTPYWWAGRGVRDGPRERSSPTTRSWRAVEFHPGP